ncbi:basic leucine zipper transcriptional factor ATF-like 3 isoform X2 [Oryctolagus cuniculus]|uniref:basic leucine zipper transcriptional factor ATF-like 3 isoform X2 n=1 Tax=Oryctolagus cuniculus TaxID=9986 RepID=UPI0022302953|nr:basic leucine zipper transcriptional factor ATF-like 3 isoform X4 [Oryctolagus cuniculus]
MSQGLPAAGGVLQRSVAAPGHQQQPQSPEDDDRKVRRREKNRVAAQRSRKKQTQKADKLHEAELRQATSWQPGPFSEFLFPISASREDKNPYFSQSANRTSV